MSAIELRGVSKAFADRTVLNAVTLSLAPAARVALTGPSGCGKTTLLRIVAGLEVPDAGDVYLRGVHVARAGRNLSEPEARDIGFMFQDLALWPHMTVTDHLTFALRYSRRPPNERSKQVQRWLELVQLSDHARAKPSTLSGGQQQRLALARALVREPSVVLMDEPLSNLDSELKAHLQSEILRLHGLLHFTLLYVTHDLAEAAFLGARILRMRAGSVLHK